MNAEPVRIGALVPLSRPGWVEAALGGTPSFVAFEGYDTILVLARALDSSWASVSVEGTRGQITFARTPGVNVWQWAWPPVQVVDRDPADPGRFRVLHAAAEAGR